MKTLNTIRALSVLFAVFGANALALFLLPFSLFEIVCVTALSAVINVAFFTGLMIWEQKAKRNKKSPETL